MLGLLLVEVLDQLLVLLFCLLETVTGVITEFLDKLQPLNGLCFNLTVVTLHELEVTAEGVQLAIKQVPQEVDVLSL